MKVVLHTEVNPEDNAMLQALYSRSAKSVTDHLEKLSNVGSGKFMQQFYLGYGHASIADCGFVTLYFEGISMLAAKAIQDNPLYNGQECSSRYIDFSMQPFCNPYQEGTPEKETVDYAHLQMRNFYTSQMEPVKEHLRQKYSFQGNSAEAKDVSAYEKTISAKAFDILRGFLPAGATTNVAWTTSLRKAHEQLVLFMHHPLKEVQTLAKKAYLELYKAYPSSFKEQYAQYAGRDLPMDFLVSLEGQEGFDDMSSVQKFYSKPTNPPITGWLFLVSPSDPSITSVYGGFAPNASLATRNKRDVPDRHDPMSRLIFDIEFPLDFGSFRDLQRHRAGYCANPIMLSGNGFHSWYFSQLPESSKQMAEALFVELSKASICLSDPRGEYPWSDNKLKTQYMLPMGTLVPVSLVYDMQEMIYVSELRSGKTVHPTLRTPAQKIAQWLSSKGVRMHADMDESDWTEKRGTQDITPK